MGIFKGRLSDMDAQMLAEAKKRLGAEVTKLDQEQRLYKVLVEDPLDFDALVRIGKKIGTDLLEVTNSHGSIVRYFFKSNRVETTSAAEEQATKEGLW